MGGRGSSGRTVSAAPSVPSAAAVAVSSTPSVSDLAVMARGLESPGGTVKLIDLFDKSGMTMDAFTDALRAGRRSGTWTVYEEAYLSKLTARERRILPSLGGVQVHRLELD